MFMTVQLCTKQASSFHKDVLFLSPLGTKVYLSSSWHPELVSTIIIKRPDPAFTAVVLVGISRYGAGHGGWVPHCDSAGRGRQYLSQVR